MPERKIPVQPQGQAWTTGMTVAAVTIMAVMMMAVMMMAVVVMLKNRRNRISIGSLPVINISILKTISSVPLMLQTL